MITYMDFINSIINVRGQWNIECGKYWEGHHIIPKCMGGEGKAKDMHPNIIWLYPREHLIAHFLLYLENLENYKLGNALSCMVFGSNKCKDYFLDIKNINEQQIIDFSLIYEQSKILANEFNIIRNREIIANTSKEDRIRKARCGGQGMKNKLANDPIFRQKYVKKQINRHLNMSKEDKDIIYNKVSSSLKKYYHSNEWLIKKEEIKKKNSETNKRISIQYREKFYEIFNHTPEWYRKYGKLKEVRELYETIKDLDKEEQKIKAYNFTSYCMSLPIKKWTCKDLEDKSNKSRKYHQEQRNKKSLFVYEIDGNIFYNSYDLMIYLNNNYCSNYKISKGLVDKLDTNGWHYNYRCRNEIKEICNDLVSKIVVKNKEN